MKNPYISLVETATGSPFRPGNGFTLLQNGDEIFPAMLEAIRGAQHTVEFLTYVFWRSEIANEFAAALVERARAGVKVRLLVDAVGGATIDTRNIWRLERAGVQVGWFRPGHWPYLRKLNNRTHRKILLVDDHTGFTGGVGIADIWTGDGQDPKHWRETHCRIIGPACLDLRTGFAENWAEATGEKLASPDTPIAPDATPDAAHTPGPAGDIAIHTAISTAGVIPTVMQRLIHAVLPAARRRLWITSAYFVPSAEVAGELIAAAARGVDVRVLTSGRLSNHPLARFAGRAAYQRLLDGGVKLYEHTRTMHHAKIITADSSWATLGSSNLDARSLVLNDELNISVVDPAIIETLDLRFLEDLKHSEHIRPSQWTHRSWFGRVAEAGSNLFRDQL